MISCFFRQSKVELSEVTQAQLVVYDHERDFLPMVYAHCDYSLEISRGTEVTYNFPGLERQLIETFVRGKPSIDVKVGADSHGMAILYLMRPCDQPAGQ